jgi:hypothetical protein
MADILANPRTILTPMNERAAKRLEELEPHGHWTGVGLLLTPERAEQLIAQLAAEGLVVVPK